LSCIDSDIEDALNHEFISLRSVAAPLCNDCNQCSIKEWCRGGYLPTRYGKGNGFMNPSIYCEDIKNIFFRLSKWLVDTGNIMDINKQEIIKKVEILKKTRIYETNDRPLH
jgi:uncharacterized protein